jgi:signal transduction histidine kinase
MPSLITIFRKRIIWQVMLATMPVLLLGLVIAYRLLNAGFLSINDVSRELQSDFQNNIQELEKEVERLTDLKYKNSAEIEGYKTILKNEAQKDELFKKGYELRGALVHAAVPLSRRIVAGASEIDPAPVFILTQLRKLLGNLTEEVFYWRVGDDMQALIKEKKISQDFVQYLLETAQNEKADWFEDNMGYRDIMVNLVPYRRNGRLDGVFCVIFDISPSYSFIERAKRLSLSLESSKIQEQRLIEAQKQEKQLQQASQDRQELIARNAAKNRDVISGAEQKLIMFLGLNMTVLISTSVLLFWLLGIRRISSLQQWLSRITADIYALQSPKLTRGNEPDPQPAPAPRRPVDAGENPAQDSGATGQGLQARIDHRSMDEIGGLCKSINSMLDSLEMTTVSRDLLKQEIRERINAEQALTQYKSRLEELIDERTKELLQSNRELQREIRERQQAEDENQKLQNQLLQMQKMDAVGTLAGGVAHDFNNILTGITGFTDLSLCHTDPHNQVHQDLKEIRKLARRGAELTRQLLTFSRQQAIEPVVLNINNLINNISKMLQRLIGENIRLRIEIADDIGNIKADPGQIEQVLVNLIVNARDAMPDGGDLLISARNIHCFDPEFAHKIKNHLTEKFVHIKVLDTGIGMTRATLERAFEPFFTTKDVGRGTGLGLSTVYGIVEKHNGHIHIASEVGKGTAVNIYFPLVEEKEPARRPGQQKAAAKNSETILLVEDEEMVREVTRRSLEKFGYMVLAASDPDEAERIFSTKHRAIDLLLTDIIMPVHDGMVLYEHLAALRPALKVLFMSGYSDKQIPPHLSGDETAPFIQKPFTAERLNIKIRQVLDKDV